MRIRWIAALAVLLAVAGMTIVSPSRADSIASVAPDSGDMHTAFTFSAGGLTPGHGILVAVYDSAGNRYSYQKSGVEQAIVVDGEGNISVSLTPAGLSGAQPGDWKAVFTEEESGYTATIPFSVSP